MDPYAVKQAKARLERARDALARMPKGKTSVEIQGAWVDFLIAADGVYSKLGAGAKSHPRSRAWYGDKMAFRKADELLNYVHQAKNADSHGLEDGIVPGAPGLEHVPVISKDPKLKPGQKLFIVKHTDGSELRFVMTLPTKLALGSVTNRGGTFKKPAMHLGQRLPSGSIMWVGGLVCDYLTSIIEEAESLTQN